MNKIFSKVWIMHSLVVLGMLIVWQIGAYVLRKMALKNGEEILAPIAKNPTIQIEGMKSFSTLEKSNLLKILNLFARVENKKELHKEAFLKFYPYHFASSAIIIYIYIHLTIFETQNKQL